MSRPRFLPDNFTLALIATVLLATFLPCSGQTAVVFEWVTNIGIGLLFFLHGAKLSRQAIIAGMTHWRLHLLVFACTFVMFPLLGLALKPALSPMVTPGCTSASCSSAPCRPRCNPPSPSPRWRSATCRQRYQRFRVEPARRIPYPLLVKLLLGAEGETGNALDAIGKITLQLLVPFIAGQVLRRWIGAWVERNKPVLRYVDQGSILLVVYTAFSAAVIQGLWHEVPWLALLGLTVACCVILALALVLTTVLARRLGFSKGRRDHHRLLRFEEEPGHRRAHGQGAVRHQCGGTDGVAADAVPPDPADGLRGARATLRQAPRRRSAAALAEAPRAEREMKKPALGPASSFRRGSARRRAQGDELFRRGRVDADGLVERLLGRPGLHRHRDTLEDLAGLGADHVAAQHPCRRGHPRPASSGSFPGRR